MDPNSIVTNAINAANSPWHVVKVALVFAFLGFLFWLLYRGIRLRIQPRLQKAEVLNRLLDKFGSAREFTEFLQTEEGRRFLDDPLPPLHSPSHRILRLVQTGIVILTVGVGCFLNAYRLSNANPPINSLFTPDYQFWGIFGVTIGLGLLLAALVTYLMASRWHLFGGNGGGEL